LPRDGFLFVWGSGTQPPPPVRFCVPGAPEPLFLRFPSLFSFFFFKKFLEIFLGSFPPRGKIFLLSVVVPHPPPHGFCFFFTRWFLALPGPWFLGGPGFWGEVGNFLVQKGFFFLFLVEGGVGVLGGQPVWGGSLLGRGGVGPPRTHVYWSLFFLVTLPKKGGWEKPPPPPKKPKWGVLLFFFFSRVQPFPPRGQFTKQKKKKTQPGGVSALPLVGKFGFFAQPGRGFLTGAQFFREKCLKRFFFEGFFFKKNPPQNKKKTKKQPTILLF